MSPVVPRWFHQLSVPCLKLLCRLLAGACRLSPSLCPAAAAAVAPAAAASAAGQLAAAGVALLRGPGAGAAAAGWRGAGRLAALEQAVLGGGRTAGVSLA